MLRNIAAIHRFTVAQRSSGINKDEHLQCMSAGSYVQSVLQRSAGLKETDRDNPREGTRWLNKGAIYLTAYRPAISSGATKPNLNHIFKAECTTMYARTRYNQRKG